MTVYNGLHAAETTIKIMRLKLNKIVSISGFHKTYSSYQDKDKVLYFTNR